MKKVVRWNLYKIKDPSSVQINMGYPYLLTHIDGHDVSVGLSTVECNEDVGDFYLCSQACLLAMSSIENKMTLSLSAITPWLENKKSGLTSVYTKFDKDGYYYYERVQEGTFKVIHQIEAPMYTRRFNANSIEEVLGFNCKEEEPCWHNRIMTAEKLTDSMGVLFELEDSTLALLRGGNKVGESTAKVVLAQSTTGDWFLGWWLHPE